jgi:4-hydroxy-tetrahydrodipicolinate reductase
MANIGIIGMGKMGYAIASVLDQKPEHIGHKFQRITPANEAQLKSCDVAIEFTIPEAAPGVIRHCIDLGIPVVSGTTGWHESHLETIRTYNKERNGTFLCATNFSVGMNIVFALNKKLAAVMANFPEFKPSIKEVHHLQKKDAPSGTAYTLLEDVIKVHSDYTTFALNPDDDRLSADTIPVTAIREGDVKGIHEVHWNSGMEGITITHEAFDRKIFAEGAVMAALWLMDRSPGEYAMKDIINL